MGADIPRTSGGHSDLGATRRGGNRTASFQEENLPLRGSPRGPLETSYSYTGNEDEVHKREPLRGFGGLVGNPLRGRRSSRKLSVLVALQCGCPLNPFLQRISVPLPAIQSETWPVREKSPRTISEPPGSYELSASRPCFKGKSQEDSYEPGGFRCGSANFRVNQPYFIIDPLIIMGLFRWAVFCHPKTAH